ncbi:MAG: glycosyltransferase family 4 protein [Planctomycetes bacterium]|nr:glycosyltransferase family 4 protein [Planctomycetota bacterium]
MHTVLQVLAQRPGLTGSGVTLGAIAREAQALGFAVHTVVGTPRSEPHPHVDGCAPDRVHPLTFETPALPFPVPGMSDVMPYPSSVFRTLDDAQWRAYDRAWCGHLERVLAQVRPDVVHAHHVWHVASRLRDIAAAGTRIVVHCHATGLRQLALCPDRAPAIVAGVRRADAFVVLDAANRDRLIAALSVDPARVHVVGAGFHEERFTFRGGAPEPDSLLYAGKLAVAKGLPELLAATARLAADRPALRLHVAGAGSGAEGDALRTRLASLAPLVSYHGRLDQDALAALMRRCHTFVLPSYYEGLPLVLVEARASGCRLVANALAGVAELHGGLGDTLLAVAPPPLAGIDHPAPTAIPAYVERLRDALDASLSRPPAPAPGAELSALTWRAVVARIAAVWTGLLRSPRG